jgi:hypothetical protein
LPGFNHFRDVAEVVRIEEAPGVSGASWLPFLWNYRFVLFLDPVIAPIAFDDPVKPILLPPHLGLTT